MTTEKLVELFDKHEDVYLQFSRVTNPRSGRPDLNAFLLLEELLPGRKADMIACSEHDQCFIEVRVDELAEVINEAQVVELIRSSICLDRNLESLYLNT